MKKIKKSLSVFLALVLLLQVIPFSVFAQEQEPEPESEQIELTLPEGGYVPGEPELLEPDAPESGEPESSDLEEPVFYRDGIKVGIFNPNATGTVSYQIGNGNPINYSEPFYLPAYSSSVSVSACVIDNNEQAEVEENLDSLFEQNFIYTEAACDFTLRYKTVAFDFVRMYRAGKWFFATDSAVEADASGYFYNAVLPDGTDMIFVKVNNTTYQNPTTGYVLETILTNNTVSAYTITIDNFIYHYGSDKKLDLIQSIYEDAITIARTSSAITVSDEENRAYTIALNALGLPASVTNPLNGVTTYTYTAGKLSTVTDPANVVVGNYSYSNGVLSKSGDTAVTCDSLGRVTGLTKDSGAYETYTYDNSLNTVEVSTSTDNITITAYNDACEVLSTSDETGYNASYTYDTEYRLLTETIDGTLCTTNTYTNGLLTATVDSDNTTVSYVYDNNGRVVEEHSSDSDYITTYSYTAEGELAKTAECQYESVHPGGNAPAALELQEKESVTYVYDDGLLIRTVDTESNQTVEYTYNAYGDVTQTDITIAGSTPTTSQSTSTYDLVGKLLSRIAQTNYVKSRVNLKKIDC